MATPKRLKRFASVERIDVEEVVFGIAVIRVNDTEVYRGPWYFPEFDKALKHYQRQREAKESR